MVHLLGVCFVPPMVKQRSRVTQRKPVSGRMDFQGVGNRVRPDGLDEFGDDAGKSDWTK